MPPSRRGARQTSKRDRATHDAPPLAHELTTTGIAPSAALPYFERAYRATKHPAFAWQALLLSLDAKLPIPDWISSYLLSAASRMSELFHDRPPKHPATAVFRALGFPSTQSQNPLRAVERDIHDFLVAFEVWGQLSDGVKFESAVALTAEAHPTDCVNHPKCRSISASTVARYWKTHKARFPPIAKQSR